MMTGTVVNALAIVVGGFIGSFLGGILTKGMRQTLIAALGIVVVMLGVEAALEWQGIVLDVILAVVIGGLLGELLKLEQRLDDGGERLQKCFTSGSGRLGQGFVYATLVYCVGPMAILGALESGLHGSHGILFAKASIDGVTAIVFASVFGPGVILSALAVLVYQGLLTLGAVSLTGIIEVAQGHITATGGIILIGLGLKILDVKQIKVANLLPSLLVAVLFAYIL